MLRNILLFLLFFAAVSLEAQVASTTITAEGEGRSIGDAVNAALSQAIGMVNGKSIESHKMMSTIEITSATENDESYLSSDNYMAVVQEHTKGVVSSFEILNKEQTEGVWLVTLSAKVAKYTAPKSAQRRAIAVMPIRSTQQVYTLNGNSLAADSAIRSVNQALVDYLVQSRKFTVLDREYQHETNNEKSIAIGGQSPVEELARMGQVLLADLVFVGSLDDFSYKTTTQKMHLSDRVITRGAGIATMGYRLVDVATQQIMASDSISIQITDADLQKEGNSSGSLIKKVLADKLALTISSKLLDVIFPLTIISVDGREVILSQGGKGVSSGQIYKIYKYGDKLYDPYTKEYIGRKESFCCQVEITRVTPKQAYGLIVEDSIDLAEGFTPKTYILREASEPKKQSVDHASKIKAIKNSHKKPSNDDW